jgi:hypothetical protein
MVSASGLCGAGGASVGSVVGIGTGVPHAEGDKGGEEPCEQGDSHDPEDEGFG